MSNSRRRFLAGLGLAAAAPIASPAIAQSAPDVRWRMTSSFTPALGLIYGGAETLKRVLSDLTDGHFQIDVAPAGEISPALEALDAVIAGKAECAHTSLSYAWKTDPSLIFAAGAPFGMTARQHAAWLAEAGAPLIDEALAEHRLAAFPAGETGAQMAGWFRKEVRGAADLNGLKMRVGGFAAKVFLTLGAEPIALAKDAVYGALEAGTLDVYEGVGPYDDERFGTAKDGQPLVLSKVASNYYYPAWWKGDMQLHLVVAKEKLDALPASYQAALRAACGAANAEMIEKYDAANPGALKRLVIGGAQLRLFPQDLLEACYKTADQLYAELGAENAKFKKLSDAFFAFRADQYLWWQVAEYSFENFMIRARRSAKG